jgi:formylglycine-generating enzyme required for sulfatase activity
LHTSFATAKDNLEATFHPQSTSRYTYKSVKVNDLGVPQYQTKFVTPLREDIQIDVAGYSTRLSLVSIMGGQFLFGAATEAPASRSGQTPQALATVNSFAIGIYPVTQHQWQAVANLPTVDISLPLNPSYFHGDELPVEQVSWYEAMEFCNRLSRHTGQRFRLPTEAEWEYACRAQTTTPFHFGATLTTDLANYDGTRPYRSEPPGRLLGRTTPVGSFHVANDFGLHDMHGNVMEWCSDEGHYSLKKLQPGGSPIFQPHFDGNAPAVPALNQRVVRGGSWQSPPQDCRSAFRYPTSPNTRCKTIGFRVVRERHTYRFRLESNPVAAD